MDKKPIISVEYTSLNAYGGNKWFIRLTGEAEGCYLHTEDYNEDEEDYPTKFIVKEGIEGAAMFATKQDAQEIIDMVSINNAEVISLFDVVGNDGSMN